MTEPLSGPELPGGPDDAAMVGHLREAREKLKAEMAKTIVGQEQVIDSLLHQMRMVFIQTADAPASS